MLFLLPSDAWIAGLIGGWTDIQATVLAMSRSRCIALRHTLDSDRLRSTAAENERLHEMLKEYRRRKDDGEQKPADQQVGPMSSVPQLEQQIKLLRENVVAAEELMAKKDAHYTQEIEQTKAEAEASRRRLESALEEHRGRLAELTRANETLENALEEARAGALERERQSESKDHDEGGVQALLERIEQQEVEMELLRVTVRDVTEERDAVRAGVEKHQADASTSLAKLQKEVELLQGLLDGARAAEREASEEARRHADISESLTEERDALRSQVAEIETEKESAGAGASPSDAADVDELRQRLALLQEDHERTARLLEEKSAALDEHAALLEQARAAAAGMFPIQADHARKEEKWASEKTQLEERIAEMKSDIAALSAREAAVARSGASQLEQLGELEARLAAQASRIDELTAANTGLEDRLSKTASETAATSSSDAELEALKAKLADAEKTNREALEHKRLTALKLDQLQSMIASGAKAVEEMRRMQATLAEKDREIQRLVSLASAAEADHSRRASPSPPPYEAIMGTDELQRSKRGSDQGVDVEYLSAVLRQSFACGELDAKSPIFGVIARLLHFTEREVEDVTKQAGSEKTAKNPASSLLELPSLSLSLSLDSITKYLR